MSKVEDLVTSVTRLDPDRWEMKRDGSFEWWIEDTDIIITGDELVVRRKDNKGERHVVCQCCPGTDAFTSFKESLREKAYQAGIDLVLSFVEEE